MQVANHRHTPNDKQKSRTIQYYLMDRRVCKRIFCSTFGISYNRIDYVLKWKNKNGLPLLDKRGKKIPGNKISHESVNKLNLFLENFPKFKSHYGTGERVYFNPHLTRKTIFDIFLELNQEVKISMSSFRTIFNTYNVDIYVPKKDRCSICDHYKMKSMTQIIADERKKIDEEFKIHKHRATSAWQELRDMEKECKADKKLLCFTFDLEKNQPIPYINVSVAFYKRNLWLYNLGINTLHDNKGTMCIWTQNDGKQGSCEVASSIFAFLNKVDLTKFRRIHTFSDCCGQNRNKNIVSLFMFIMNTTPITSWSHTFLESGHSFLPNHTDFEKIEKNKNTRFGVFSYENWIDLIKACKFDVLEMKDNFLNFGKIADGFKFKETNTFEDEFPWLKLKWLRLTSGSDFMEYKLSSDVNEDVQIIDFHKQNPLKSSKNALQNLYDTPLKINFKKYDDILFMLKYVPPIYHDYLTELPHESTTRENDEIDDVPEY